MVDWQAAAASWSGWPDPSSPLDDVQQTDDELQGVLDIRLKRGCPLRTRPPALVSPDEMEVSMSKIKVFSALPRKAGLSREEFHDHWRHPHATLGRRVPVLTKYVQSHQIDSELLGDDQYRYDGIAEGWMDNAVDVIAFGQDPWYQDHVAPDEPNFMDQTNMKFLATTETVLQSSPGRALPRPVGDEFWFDDDRATNIKIIQLIEAASDGDWVTDDDVEQGVALGAFRHVRSEPVAAIHGDEPPFVGVRELWWPTVGAFRACVANAPNAFERLITRVAASVTVLVQSERFK